MPELPEVETVRRTAERFLLGRRVASVRLARRDIVTGSWKRPALLEGAVIASVDRHGKNLAIVAEDGRVLGVHLGMTGQLLCLPGKTRPARTDHVHAVWTLGGRPGDPSGIGAGAGGAGGRLLFRDPRRFGGLETFPNREAMAQSVWGRLGPDAASVTGKALRAALSASKRPVKAGLLDQEAVAGIGNIYADEALFAAGIHPLRACVSLTGPEWTRLAKEVRRVLAAAIEAGGSTLRDYRDASGGEGRFQGRHRVYGRSGLPCVRCGTTLERLTVAQRTTVACPSCQPILTQI